MSPAEYRAYADKARAASLGYRTEAATADEPRKAMLLQWAVQCEEHADFYDSRAEIHEDYERRHIKTQEAA